MTARAGLLLIALLGVAPAASAAIVTPACDWPIQIAPSRRNGFYPDAIASYWVMPFTVQDGLRIVVSGTFADARYASFNVYTNTPSFGSPFVTNGVGSSLADYLIDPDPGSLNPWQQAAPTGGHFTITLRKGVTPGTRNTLPLAPEATPAGTPGWVIYRVYLPAGGTAGDDYYDFDSVALPRVRFELGGETQDVAPCKTTPALLEPADAALLERVASGDDAVAPVPRAAPAGAASALPGELWFYRPPNEEFVGGFPNADSAYVGATAIAPPAEREVIVIRGKAPRHPRGLLPSPWPAPGQLDVRYWSMCTYTFTSLDPDGNPVLSFPLVVNRLPDGSVDYGCRHDDITALDGDGFFTYVIGTESQRARIERVDGATFLPFSLEQPRAPHSIYFRNMVPADDYRQGCQYVPYVRDPEAAAAVMGEYYPRSSVCGLATLVREGAVACLENPRPACAFAASERIELGPGTHSLDADVLGGEVELRSKVGLDDGTLAAGARVVLGARSRVFDVDAASLEQGAKATIAGVVGSTSPPAEPCDVPEIACSGTGVVLERGEAPRTLQPGVHGRLRMAARTQLVLAPGRHVFCGVEVGRGARIEATGTRASTIDVVGPLTLARKSSLGVAAGTPSPLVRVAGAHAVAIGPRAVVQAQLRAPQTTVEIGRAAQMTGGGCARSLRTGRRAELRCAAVD